MALKGSLPGIFWVWVLVACWRLLLAVCVRTSFDPDEYWQGPEVAHRLVFGYGHLTWEWASGLRSYAHPLLFTPAYALLKLLGEDFPIAVQLAPRLTQVLVTLAHDDALLTFAAAHLPPHLHQATWLVSCISWFNCFTHSRPFSNSIESTLHLLCLANWPLASSQSSNTAGKQHNSRHRAQRAVAITLAGLCCVIRPPSVVLFLPLAISELVWLVSSPGGRVSSAGSSLEQGRSSQHISRKLQHCAVFLFDGLALAVVVVVGAGALDYAFYGRFVFPAWVNLEFNVLQNSSADYGAHPFHWYFSQGMPAMLASLLPLVVWGAVSVVRKTGAGAGVPLWPLLLGIWGIALHSVLAHKEFRYVLPSFELVLLYAAVPVASCLQAARASTKKDVSAVELDNAASSAPEESLVEDDTQLRHRLRSRHRFQPVAAKSAGADTPENNTTRRVRYLTWQSVACWVCCLLQLPTLAYFGLVHQRGTVAVMEHLSHAQLPSGSNILFLTNCHATPWQAHMHRKDVHMSFLDCSPSQWYQATRAQNVQGAIGTFSNATLEAPAMSEQRTFERDPLAALCRVYGCGMPMAESDGNSDQAVRECEGPEGCKDVPTHIIAFDDMASTIKPFLDQQQYKLDFSHVQNQFDQVYVHLYKTT